MVRVSNTKQSHFKTNKSKILLSGQSWLLEQKQKPFFLNNPNLRGLQSTIYPSQLVISSLSPLRWRGERGWGWEWRKGVMMHFWQNSFFRKNNLSRPFLHSCLTKTTNCNGGAIIKNNDKEEKKKRRKKRKKEKKLSAFLFSREQLKKYHKKTSFFSFFFAQTQKNIFQDERM